MFPAQIKKFGMPCRNKQDRPHVLMSIFEIYMTETSIDNTMVLYLNHQEINPADGVQLFKSSKVSMWPIWLVINELPPALR